MGKEQASTNEGIKEKGFWKTAIAYHLLFSSEPGSCLLGFSLGLCQDLALILVLVVLREMEAWSYQATELLGCLSGGKGA